MRWLWTELWMEELRVSFSVDSDSQCSPGLLVHPTASMRVSLAQGKELRLCGQKLWLEVQSYHDSFSFSVHIVCMCCRKFQAGNTFFLRVGPNGQVSSNKTDATRRFSTDPSATLSFSQSRSLPFSLVARKPTKAQGLRISELEEALDFIKPISSFYCWRN